MRSYVWGALLVVLLGLVAVPPAEAARRAKPYDFDGNGHPDLVVGAPGLQVNGQPAGGVVVLPASATGMSQDEKVITQSSRGVPGASEAGDEFGRSIASGDFNRDGYADLAIGAPGETSAKALHVGAVTVVYGSAHGLGTKHARRLRISTRDVYEANFGTSLVAADFDRDGFADLAVGSPGAAPAVRDEFFQPSGTVSVFGGGRKGLSRAAHLVLRGDRDASDGDMRFGERIAAGDLDLDGDVDLVVASDGFADSGDDSMPGSLSYCLNGRSGPRGCARLAYGVGWAGPSSVLVANVWGSERPEIVLAKPVGFDDDEGHVTVLRLKGSKRFTVAEARSMNGFDVGLPGTGDWAARLGASVDAGDVDRDGYADLVMGAPGANDGRGRVLVARGGADGPRSTGNEAYSQDSPGVPNAGESQDYFGSSVTLLDHDQDGRLDLTVGAPGENGSGAITTLRGAGDGFTAAGSRTFDLRSLGYEHPEEAGFGGSLGHR